MDTLLAHPRSLRQALAIAIEFVFNKSVCVQNKLKKTWSSVRPLVQDAMRKGISRTKSSATASDGAAGLAAITDECMRESLVANVSTPGEKNVMLWLTEASAESVRKWIAKNGSNNVTGHAAFGAAVTKLVSRLCRCRKDASSCPVHADATLTLADLLWLAADAIFDNVPTAVCTLPLAMALKCQQSPPQAVNVGSAGSAASAPECLPVFCRFLCVQEKEKDGDATDQGEKEAAWVPNNPAVQTLLMMRATYLARVLMSSLSTLTRASEVCKFADVQASKILKVCQALLRQLEATDTAVRGNNAGETGGAEILCLLETLLLTMVCDETEWSAGWCKLILKCLEFADLDVTGLDSKICGLKLLDLGLDVPPKYRYMMKNPTLAAEAKDEITSPLPRGRKRSSEELAEENQSTQMALACKDIYSYPHKGGVSSWHVLDFLSLRHQVTHHLYIQACEPQC